MEVGDPPTGSTQIQRLPGNRVNEREGNQATTKNTKSTNGRVGGDPALRLPSFFIELTPKQISKEKLFVDPWGTPYVFDLAKPSDPRAYSFGRNKRDEGGNGDDVASWKY